MTSENQVTISFITDEKVRNQVATISKLLGISRNEFLARVTKDAVAQYAGKAQEFDKKLAEYRELLTKELFGTVDDKFEDVRTEYLLDEEEDDE